MALHFPSAQCKKIDFKQGGSVKWGTFSVFKCYACCAWVVRITLISHWFLHKHFSLLSRGRSRSAVSTCKAVSFLGEFSPWCTNSIARTPFCEYMSNILNVYIHVQIVFIMCNFARKMVYSDNTLRFSITAEFLKCVNILIREGKKSNPLPHETMGRFFSI